MTTILVLGSKPDPILPQVAAIDALACANASGRSALGFALPPPTLTVISSVLASGKNPSNSLALKALAGLSTGSLYIYPRPPFAGRPLKKLRHIKSVLRTTPLGMQLILNNTGFQYKSIHFCPLEFYLDLIFQLCGESAHLRACVDEKVPSTGMIAILLALRENRYERVIVSGFSFEITHAYASNPDIANRGSTTSLHASTDVAILTRLAECDRRLITSEPIVHERTGLPLLRFDGVR